VQASGWGCPERSGCAREELIPAGPVPAAADGLAECGAELVVAIVRVTAANDVLCGEYAASGGGRRCRDRGRRFADRGAWSSEASRRQDRARSADSATTRTHEPNARSECVNALSDSLISRVARTIATIGVRMALAECESGSAGPRAAASGAVAW
jgi:hypothetical protein